MGVYLPSAVGTEGHHGGFQWLAASWNPELSEGPETYI